MAVERCKHCCNPDMSKLVLVTGANGFVGTNTALYFLQRGWRVRGAVRSAEKQNALNSNRSLKPFYDKGALETVIIPSREDETAWKAALRGVDGVSTVTTGVIVAWSEPAGRARRRVYGLVCRAPSLVRRRLHTGSLKATRLCSRASKRTSGCWSRPVSMKAPSRRSPLLPMDVLR